MSTTFLITVAVALVALLYWRVVLVVAVAVLLAFVLVGIGTVSDALAGHPAQNGTPGSSQVGEGTPPR
jgi:hypothetical protein